MPILSPFSASPTRQAASAQASIRPSGVHRLLVEQRMDAPQQPAAADHLGSRRERQHGRPRPVGRDQHRRRARVGGCHDALEAELVDRSHGSEGDRVVLVVGLRAALGEPAPVGQLALDRRGDGGHHLHREHGVLAHRRLLGEHHRVRAVEDRVGHVGHLGARGPGGVNHRLEHLSGRDRRLGAPPGHGEQALLHERDLLDRQLDAEVAARDHDPVGRVDDLLGVRRGLRLLDLGDQRHLGAALA